MCRTLGAKRLRDAHLTFCCAKSKALAPTSSAFLFLGPKVPLKIRFYSHHITWAHRTAKKKPAFMCHTLGAFVFYFLAFLFFNKKKIGPKGPQ
jgi:hypothetical protein